ncbi:uridine kinase [Phytomonospora endophytica]|uniref:Uridine kinase n=1 Tax=Phytomonospora endophytica TaxID=714109 RepID=A0A841FSD1_9ACTN|nr:uridine kinase [Phytomonospora endophytica]MBB6036217.1 uridine kinase [Phytomonospora endophytica]GIG67123.1 hypothetical protein Pen01_34180 [Phytomonospora endophytica]
MATTRDACLARLAADLLARVTPHPLRVAVDGPDAAGKTTLADELVSHLAASRPVIRLSVDRFHRPEAVRRRRGSLSAEGYYRDSFDHDVIVGGVLRPLGPGGDRRYLPAVYDHRADSVVPATPRQAPPEAIVLFDGVFLLRPELREHWDASIYLHVGEDETLARALVRDLALFGSAAVVEERYRRRYLPGQRLYRAEARPADHADVVLDMTDPRAPVVLRRG